MQELRYHHIGIPTDATLPKQDDNEEYGTRASGYSATPYGVEWMHFERARTLPEWVKTAPHATFTADDMVRVIKGKDVLIERNRPADDVTVPLVVGHAAPIELLHFDRSECEIWPREAKFGAT